MAKKWPTQQYDFPDEFRLLNMIGEKSEGDASDTNPTSFPQNEAYASFYQKADQGYLKTRVVRKPNQGRYKQCFGIEDIPTSVSSHIRGHLVGTRSYTGRTGSDDRLLLKDVARCTFHSQPTHSVDSDVPSHEDIFDFIKFSHLRHIVAGKTKISILDKSRQTLQLSLDLWSWESDKKNAYKLKRLIARHEEDTPQPIRNRYAKIALKGIGLQWPYASYAIRRDWPMLLRNLGVVVTQHDAVPKRAASDSVLMILANKIQPHEAAKWHNVSQRKIGEWVRAFKAAGAAAINK